MENKCNHNDASLFINSFSFSTSPRSLFQKSIHWQHTYMYIVLNRKLTIKNSGIMVLLSTTPHCFFSKFNCSLLKLIFLHIDMHADNNNFKCNPTSNTSICNCSVLQRYNLQQYALITNYIIIFQFSTVILNPPTDSADGSVLIDYGKNEDVEQFVYIIHCSDTHNGYLALLSKAIYSERVCILVAKYKIHMFTYWAKIIIVTYSVVCFIS